MMNEVKEIITHNQIKNLSQLYTMLVVSLQPAVVQTRNGLEVVQKSLPSAAVSAIEVALIDVANRISEMAKESTRWTIDKSDQEDYSNQIAQQAREMEETILHELMQGLHPKPKAVKKSRQKRKGTDEQE